MSTTTERIGTHPELHVDIPVKDEAQACKGRYVLALIAAVPRSLLLTMMWAAQLRMENNPFMDDHIVYALVLVALAVFGAGRTRVLGRRWEKTKLVRRFPILK